MPVSDSADGDPEAVCGSCRGEVASEGRANAASIADDGLDRPPRGVRVDRHGSAHDITCRVSLFRRWVVLLMSVLLPGVMAHGPLGALEGHPLASAVLRSVALVTTLALAYRALVGLFNTRHVLITRYELTVATRGPLRWFSDRTIHRPAIDQVYCKARRDSTGHGASWTTYGVYVALRGGRRQTIVAGLTHNDQALFVEREIERAMGIEDHPVHGESRRRPS